jgi:transposase
MSGTFYDSDLTDQEWQIIEPLLPAEKSVGRGRQVDLRSVFNAIVYRADNGVKWRNLPKDFPAWQTVYSYFSSWSRFGVLEQINGTIVRQVRVSEGRAAEPSLVIIDSQSVKLDQKGGRNRALMAIRR